MVCLVARRKKKSDEETAQRLEGSSKLQPVVSCRRTQQACQGRAWIGGGEGLSMSGQMLGVRELGLAPTGDVGRVDRERLMRGFWGVF